MGMQNNGEDNSVYYLSHIKNGVDMEKGLELNADRERVKAALVLLMDEHYGLLRIERTRERILALPRWIRGAVGTCLPLNYLVDVCKEDPSNRIPMLDLLDRAEAQHKELWSSFRDAHPALSSQIEMLRRNSQKLRDCYQYAYAIEAKKRGRMLSKLDRINVAADYKAKWARWRAEFISEHPELVGREITRGQALNRNVRMKEEYEAVFGRKESEHPTEDEIELEKVLAKRRPNE